MKAIIIGGGIAGPAAAMAFQHVGVDASVFEAHPASDAEVGSYFTVTANGLEALRLLGAYEIVAEAGFPTRRNVLWNGAGRRLATVTLDSTLPGSPAPRTLKRSVLARLLRDEARRRGIQVESGRGFVSATMTPDDHVVARFEDGSEAFGDLLVGADGVHSAVRRLIDPDAPESRYVGLTNFGGFTPGAASGIEPEAWHLIFGRRAFFGYIATPARDVVWFANVPGPQIGVDERASMSEDAWKARLIERFADDEGPAADLISAGRLELAADNTHDLGHVPTWHRGPMVVVGDAAHAPAPSSGQGASMALEDAIVLATALRGSASVPEALAAYERSRRERVERIVAWGARGSSTKIPGALGRVARDVMLRLVLGRFLTAKSLSWMYDYRVALPSPAGAAAVLAS